MKNNIFTDLLVMNNINSYFSTIQALTTPEAANNRHIISTDSVWMKDIALAVAKEFKPQGYSIPTGQLPYFLCWVAGLFNKGMKNNILPRIGKVMKVDNKRVGII